MGRKSKKFLGLLLAAVMATAAFAGCSSAPQGGSSTPSNGGEATPPATNEPETNATREKVTIRFSQFGNNLDDAEGMKNDPIKKAIEDAVNVELKYESGTDGYDDNITTMLSAGDAPDLFPTWGEADKIKSWSADEAVIELGSIVSANPDRYPTLAKMFSDETYKAYNKLYTGDENKVYAIYGIAAFAEPSFAGVPVYSSKILNEVNGGKVPDTMEEFIEFLNKCGAAGYSGYWPRNDKLTNWAEMDKAFAAPQGTSIAPPKGSAWTGFVPSAGDSDVWKLMTTSEESKEVVKTLAALYKSKGLDNGIGVQDDFSDAKSNFCLNKIGGVGFGFGYPGQFKDLYVSDWEKANPDTAQETDITMGVAPKGTDGRGKSYDTGTWVNSHYFIPANCKNPERVLDLVEYLASQSGQDLMHNCTSGAFRTDQGSDYWNGVNKAYNVSDGRCKYVWFSYLFSGVEYMVDFANTGWYDSVAHPIDWSTNWATEKDQSLLKTARSVINTFVGESYVQLPSYYNFVALDAEAESIRAKMQELTNNYLPAMINGTMDIDSNWAAYQAAYEEAGASTLETMLNEAIQTAKAMA